MMSLSSTPAKMLIKSTPILFLISSFAVLAQNPLDSLQSERSRPKRDSLRITEKIKQSRETHRKAHNEKEEYQDAEQAIQDALVFGDTLLYAKALDNLGLLYRYHQHYDEAFPLHRKAYSLIEHQQVPSVFKMIFANNAGVAARYDQKYDAAVSYYMKALKIAERENDLKNIAISCNGIGNTLGNIDGREDEALHYFHRSLKAEKKRNNSLGVAMNYLSIGDYFIDKKEYALGRKYLEELMEINKKRNDLFGLAITNEYLGLSYLEEGKNFVKATSFLQGALEGFTQLNNKHKQAEILTHLGKIQGRQHQPEAALPYYRQSLALAKEMNQHGLIMENSLLLAQALEENQPARALHYFKQGKAYQDSIKLSEQKVEIAALVRKYDLEKKEDHIRLLQKDKALQQTLLSTQEQELERRRMLLILLGSAFLFILIILLLQYRNFRTKKKTNARILKEEKEKLSAIYERNLAQAEILVTRLRINPHFIFNSLNAITYLIQTKENSRAVKYLVVFSRYTRMVLETSQKHVIPLREELKLTRYYLTLEENRFEKGFIYRIKGEELPEIREVHIPPLLLQPFIENGIWHGLLPSKRQEKVLNIEVCPQDEFIKIIVDDNGVGRTGSKKKKNAAHRSMGMEITEERIALFNKSYSGKIEYEVVDKADEKGQSLGTCVRIKIYPQKKDAPPAAKTRPFLKAGAG